MLTQTQLRFDLLSALDAELLSAVANRAYADYYLHLWHDGGAWYVARSFTPDVFRRELNDPNARFYLIYSDDEPIGFLKLNIDQPSPCQPGLNALELERIYLQKKATGSGIGDQAISFVVDQARALNKEVVWLKAMESSDKVIAFYGKMGFVVCGTSRLPYTMMREELRQMVSMQLML